MEDKPKYVPKRIVDGTCPFCGGKDFSKISPGMANSKIYCDNCKAIFNALDLNEKELAGVFTEMYFPATKADLYRHSFFNENKEK